MKGGGVMGKKKLGWKQRLREQPVIAFKVGGAVVSAVLAYTAPRYGFDLSPELRELVIVCWLVALGVDVPVTILQWFKVTPVAKQARLAKEVPASNPEVPEMMGRGRR
jgi:hypothetical protein